MPHSPQNFDLDAVGFRQGDQGLRVDKAYVARAAGDYDGPGNGIQASCGVWRPVRLVRPRHHLVNYGFSLRGDPVHDLIHTDRMRDMVNKEQQPRYTSYRREHRSHNRCHRSEELR